MSNQINPLKINIMTTQLTQREAVKLTLDACTMRNNGIIPVNEMNAQISEFVALSGIAFDSLMMMATCSNFTDFI